MNPTTSNPAATLQPPGCDVVIIGCGNLLRGDDGVGPVLVRHLWERGVPDGAKLVDGGTAGMDVAFQMRGAGRVVIIDDVVTAGTSVGEAIEIIESAGAQPTALAIALDREEKTSENGHSAVQDVRERLGLKVHPIARFSELIEYLRCTPDLGSQVGALEAYRDRYGVVGK